MRPRQSSDSVSTRRSGARPRAASGRSRARPRPHRGSASRPSRRSRGGSRRRSRAARPRPRRCGRLARSCSACAGVTSAWCVTSSPTIVTSSPLAKTRCAASGSAQMLNSAAGVTLPSAIAPPISTIRSGFASGWRASRSATFVSGPVATSVAPSAPICSARKSTACCGERLGAAAAAGRGRRGRVSPWTCGRDARLAHERPAAPAATGNSVRPASSSTRIALAVVFSSVWLPATVVTPTQLDLRRSRARAAARSRRRARVAVEQDRRRS